MEWAIKAGEYLTFLLPSEEDIRKVKYLFKFMDNNV